MNEWSALTTEDLVNYLIASQLRLLAEQGREGEDPRLAVIEDVVEQVRLEIASYEGNYISPINHTIPLALKTPVCHLIVEALQARIPGMELTRDQVRNAQNARAFLRRIAVGEVVITRSGAPRMGRNRLEVCHKRPRQATGLTLGGF